jgi:hypothetical protein
VPQGTEKRIDGACVCIAPELASLLTRSLQLLAEDMHGLLGQVQVS